MSEAALNRLFDEFAAKVPEACAAGKGLDLFHDFLAASAAQLADTVFLKMEAEMDKVTSDEQAAVLWHHDYHIFTLLSGRQLQVSLEPVDRIRLGVEIVRTDPAIRRQPLCG